MRVQTQKELKLTFIDITQNKEITVVGLYIDTHLWNSWNLIVTTHKKNKPCLKRVKPKFCNF